MPINIICPGCHARFTVGDKFAGKQGPCPKCKTVINIPKASEEVKIHAPEDYGGAKSTTGKLVLKPISRTDVKLKATWVLAIGAATIITVGVAFMLGKMFPPEPVGGGDATATVTPEKPDQPAAPSPAAAAAEPEPTDQGPPMVSTVPSFVLGVGALLLSLPLVLAGYSFLRNDEMEPFRRQELWIRAAICALVYTLLWGVYAMLRAYGVIPDHQSAQVWVFAGPVFFAAGGAAAYLSLDLEFGSAAMHYGLYLLVTILLRMIMGLNPA